VAVGKLDANHNAVITSTDGRVWSAPDTIKDCVYNNFVYFVNGKFLVWEACGDSFQTSPDGLTWTEVKPPSGLGGNLVYGNGKYVSSAGTGVRASIDLTNWKDSMLAPYSGTTQGVGFGFGKFIVVGDAGMIHFSDDGENWIRDSSTQFYSLNLQAVAIGEDRIVAVGTNGTVLVSLQGEAGLGPKVSRIAGQPPGFAPALRFHRGRMGVQHQGREFGMDGRRFLEPEIQDSIRDHGFHFRDPNTKLSWLPHTSLHRLPRCRLPGVMEDEASITLCDRITLDDFLLRPA
jgi:hypothetical protein